ncbi:MAG TPA: hypothetical protein VGO98_00885 [Candidatus Saccharimonadales bacterium]|jgi:hypothetical protein|nr:hypothetical protein [Candidatus Saccharimonadales bacterium]
MKENFITSLKLILSDRLMVVILALFILACTAYCIYVGASLQPSDLQVAVHYTAFGGTSFYREKWYYLISFIMFGFILAVVHTILIIKLYVQERRQMAIMFAWLSFLLLFIGWMITSSVLKVAFL